jgi:hypothetical protein
MEEKTDQRTESGTWRGVQSVAEHFEVKERKRER